MKRLYAAAVAAMWIAAGCAPGTDDATQGVDEGNPSPTGEAAFTPPGKAAPTASTTAPGGIPIPPKMLTFPGFVVKSFAVGPQGSGTIQPTYPNGAGPWPTAPSTVFPAKDGLDTGNLIGASTDETQNLWAASNEALYLLKPGTTTWRKYTDADGLHLKDAEAPGITAITGGAGNEVWVGYAGAGSVDPQHDPARLKGKLDRVQLNPDGTLKVTHYDVHNNDGVGFDKDGNVIRGADGCADPQYTDVSYNENRTVESMLYDHLYHRGSLYVGFNHGVTRIDAGRRDSTTCVDFADHVHVVAYDSKNIQRMGDWAALALDPSERMNWKTNQKQKGVLWMGGKWAAGAIGWTPELFDWTFNSHNPFVKAFTNPPVFPVTPGDDVIHIRGIAALSNGNVYLASGPSYNFSPLGVALYKEERFPVQYIQPGDMGLPSWSITGMQRLPDDTVLITLEGGGLWHWDPNPEPNGRMIGQVKGLPSNNIRSVYVDQMVTPPAVYVATDNGVGLLRF